MANEHREVGAILLSAFTESQMEKIIDFVASHGRDSIMVAQRTQRKLFLRPVLGFIPVEEIEEDDVAHILRGVFVIVQDFLGAQWTTDQYALALSRGGGVPLDLATQIVRDRVITPDSDMRGFAKKMMSWVWDIPGPIDDAIRGGIHLLDTALDRMVPTDWRNYSKDVLFELRNLGMAMKDMGLRTKLSLAESAFEGSSPTTGAPGDSSTALAESTSALATVAKALARLMSVRKEAGDLGDVQDRDIESLMRETGDLLSRRPMPGTPEEGGFLDSIGGLLKKAVPLISSIAPIAGMVAGGPLGSAAASLGTGLLSKLAGGSAPAVHHMASLPLPGTRPGLSRLESVARAAGSARGPRDLEVIIRQGS